MGVRVVETITASRMARDCPRRGSSNLTARCAPQASLSLMLSSSGRVRNGFRKSGLLLIVISSKTDFVTRPRVVPFIPGLTPHFHAVASIHTGPARRDVNPFRIISSLRYAHTSVMPGARRSDASSAYKDCVVASAAVTVLESALAGHLGGRAKPRRHHQGR
jgi:hypothetical protein